MTKIEAIVRPGKLEDVKDALNKLGIHGMTVSQVIGCGHQKGRKEVYRGAEYSINLLPKVKVELIVKDNWVDKCVEVISEAAHSGEIGDGKIFLYPVTNVIRIRTSEQGEEAI
ncbi:nitrogen regulatory protein P-II [Desulforamulus reducens MI-1]|uniref:Nitrogen regulatory protein P-II n=1 Tax=Desulforamulus reducens (strain ATCC BAA-1160 / DSM 100696 / MI-1) TaxID=349161 RepID=A4J8G2_DESRM|nr:P-II family nitrogen regulator [Desulforamulus reducens]ABO51365.1 nitrogen regulatory protein P-II [Desulforamulus reducens MI-1]